MCISPECHPYYNHRYLATPVLGRWQLMGDHSMSQKICAKCGKANLESETFCAECGYVLPDERATLNTQPLSALGQPQPELRWGTAFFEDRMVLQLTVKDTGDTIQYELGEDCVLGRKHGETSVPDLDLAPFKAIEHGVSRRHARLTRQSLTVMVQDLGSVNGTFLNGMRLVPFQPRVLRNEDELVLGRLALHVSFQRSVVPKFELPGEEPEEPEEPVVTPPDARLPVGPTEPVVSQPDAEGKTDELPDTETPAEPSQAKRDTGELKDAAAPDGKSAAPTPDPAADKPAPTQPPDPTGGES
jgi:hypothetical protein